MKTTVYSSAALASAAIALALSGTMATPALAKKAPVHCSGINSCKGMGACKTANNAGKGQNACKGQGFVEVKSQKVCEAKGGSVVE